MKDKNYVETPSFSLTGSSFSLTSSIGLNAKLSNIVFEGKSTIEIVSYSEPTNNANAGTLTLTPGQLLTGTIGENLNSNVFTGNIVFKDFTEGKNIILCDIASNQYESSKAVLLETYESKVASLGETPEETAE